MSPTELKPAIDTAKALDQILLEGEENSITGEVLKKLLDHKDTRAIRQAMVEMRHHDIAVIGGKKGYFKAATLNEIESARERIKKQIRGLCIDLRDLKRISKKYAGQLKLI